MFFESDHESVDFYFSGSLIENGSDRLILLIEGYDLLYRLWLSVIQPVEECHKRV